MTLTELRYVIALAKEMNFSKAAKACAVSQPTLSIAINKLEKKLGVTLFERLANDLYITEIGRLILSQAQRVLSEIDVIKQIADNGKEQLNSPLKIGAIYTVAPYLFPRLIPQLTKIAPKMPLIIQEDYTANLKKKLLSGDLDIIFTALPFEAAGIVHKKLYDEPFVILMRKDHPLSQNKMVSSSELTKENLLLLGEGHCIRDQVIQACPGCYASHRIQTIEGTSLETLRHMVASGMGITVLPNTATDIKNYHSILCTKPFYESPMRQVALAWRVSFPKIKVIDAIIQALVACKLYEKCVMAS